MPNTNPDNLEDTEGSRLIAKRWYRLFFVNGVLLAVSIIAELIPDTSQWAQTTVLVSFTSPWSILFQIILALISVLVAVILTELDFTRSSLKSDISQIRADTAGVVKKFSVENQRFQRDLSRGIVEYGGASYRALKFFQNTGEIYYGDPDPANRNILFNNATIKTIFEEVAKAKVRANTNTKTLLYTLGFEASKRFARHFEKYMSKKVSGKFDLYTWLNEWAEYDSNAGFGYVSVRKNEETRCTVTITHCFLSHGDDYNRPVLSDFMIGYIEGLLKNLNKNLYADVGLDRERIHVHHDPTVHSLYGHEDPSKGDIFIVEIPRTA